ncbi:Gldg family protein [Caproicibacter sp.]|uniref:Gldg family protein n=1 Tax=Caproicibacter sp. TaxID=2814884 RepID=UPI0039895F04
MNQEKDPRTGAAVPEEEIPEEKAAGTQQAEAENQQESPAETDTLDAGQNPEPEEKKEDSQKTEKEKKGGNKPKKDHSEFFKSSKFRHGSISTAFTAGFIVVVVLVNLLVGIVGERFPSVNLDLTKTGSNSLSSEGMKVVDKVSLATTITVCATKQQVEGDQIYADQGLKYSQVGSLLAKMAERNPKIQVQYIDLDKNPTFAAEYQSDSLTAGDVVVKTDKRHRVLTYSDLFNIQYSQDYSSSQVYSNVEGALVSALNAVTSEKLPTVAFDTGHAEQQDMTGYQKLLNNNSFETKSFNLLTDAIPDNTQMIVLGLPTRDYTDAEIKKLSDFLGSKTLAGDRSLMVTFSPSQASMPKLATFMEEWGIQVPQAVVVESDQSKFISNNPSDILSDIQSNLQIKKTSDGSAPDYGYFVTPQASPIKLLFETKGDKHTYSLAKSSDSCYLVDNSTKSTDNLPKQASNTAALSQETVKNGDKDYNANVIAIGSSLLFTDGVINSSAFGNGTYMVDLAKYATGTADSSSEVQLSTQPLNATDITMTSQVSTFLGLGVFILLIPLIVAVLGILVYNKRRHL